MVPPRPKQKTVGVFHFPFYFAPFGTEGFTLSPEEERKRQNQDEDRNERDRKKKGVEKDF